MLGIRQSVCAMLTMLHEGERFYGPLAWQGARPGVETRSAPPLAYQNDIDMASRQLCNRGWIPRNGCGVAQLCKRVEARFSATPHVAAHTTARGRRARDKRLLMGQRVLSPYRTICYLR